MVRSFEVAFPAPRVRRCPVFVGVGALDLLVEKLTARPIGRPLVAVADSNVAPLYAEPLVRRLRARGLAAELLVFPAGEEHKNRRTKAVLEDRLLRLGVGREGSILAVGGGVTGDLAGFLASTWQRGIPFVQVPTSLVAMVDAALGGKTAVNLPRGKNLVGSFHQPAAIYADLSTLATLGPTEYREGLAELAKTAVVADGALFRWLERRGGALVARAAPALRHAVGRCLELKARIVEEDEREAGRREMLNFGHTVGHAIETVSGYRQPHGLAVAAGMMVEGRLAVAKTGLPPQHLERLRALLGAWKLPTTVPCRWGTQDLLRACSRDKKARAGRPRYALPLRLGRMPDGHLVSVEVADEDLRRALQASRGRAPRA